MIHRSVSWKPTGGVAFAHWIVQYPEAWMQWVELRQFTNRSPTYTLVCVQVVYKEPLDWYPHAMQHGPVSRKFSLRPSKRQKVWLLMATLSLYFLLVDESVFVPSRTHLQAPNSTSSSAAAAPTQTHGISHLSWNASGTHLALVSLSSPHQVHIYSFLPSPASPLPPQQVVLECVIALKTLVGAVKWCPAKTRLAVVPAGHARGNAPPGIVFWDDDDNEEWQDDEEDLSEWTGGRPRRRHDGIAQMVAIPMETFVTHDVQWSPDGQCLVVLDKTQFVMLNEAAPSSSTALAS